MLISQIPAAALSVSSSISVFSSTVIKVEDGLYHCQSSNSHLDIICAKSKSLLVEPMVGDTVVITTSDDSAYIIGVLWSTFSNVSICSSSSTLISSPSISFVTNEFSIKSRFIEIDSYRANVVTRHLSLVSDKIKLMSSYVFNQVDLLVSRFKNRVAKLENNDVIISKQIHLKATDLIRQQSNLIQINAKSYVLVDGKKILLG